MNDELIRNILKFVTGYVKTIHYNKINKIDHIIKDKYTFEIKIRPSISATNFNYIINAMKREFIFDVEDIYVKDTYNGDRITLRLKDNKQIRIEKIKEILKEND